ncbi:MAG: hypothetical protein NTZ55_05915 [Candidatus Roizmanbacteria bacterium]|nr:hypothetical protein [Candidatus Roizmanbacteria bacterium]
MKRNKKLLLQVGVLLFVLGVFIFALEQQKKFATVDFSKRYSQNKTIEVAGFEEGEQWLGNYSYDSQRLLEGKSSITLSSWYGKENSIEKTQDIQIPPGYTKGYLSVYVADKQNLLSLVSFTLELQGEKDQKKEYNFTQQMSTGWNRLAIAVPGWKKITKRSFTVLSKPGTIAEVNLDRFWIENTSVYASELFQTQSKALSLRTIGERTYLFSASPVLENYQLSNPSSLRRGTITFSLIPEHGKEMSLSLNGTSIKLSNSDITKCSLLSNDVVSSSKTLKKNSGADNVYTFLKAEIQGDKIAYSLSNNGIDFESCGTVAFTERKPVQLGLQGSYLLDSYSVEY